jgi:hypothetical protein
VRSLDIRTGRQATGQVVDLQAVIHRLGPGHAQQG